ncbi:MAG: hypothetical protein J0I32_09475 [Sphingobacteriales bacterium]|nr:hypothetical protein [Sphingobacteriales bacterium]OJW00228.1 MAG: hypothetical protein BGO52_03845 [Sphingobacteriales bacterium 44-61]
MKKYTYLEMLRRCEELTRNGESLAITWNGGNDSGYHNIEINNQKINSPGEIDEVIIDLVAKQAGYGSFTGNFSTDGQVIYNPENKCFQGKDNYSESGWDEHSCEILIEIPQELWFDRLDIAIEQLYDENAFAEASFLVINGPYTPMHNSYQQSIQETIDDRVATEVEKIVQEHTEIADTLEINTAFSINFNEFQLEKGKYIHKINSLDYSYQNRIVSDITISLND